MKLGREYSSIGFYIQLFFNVRVMMLQYLEVLNVYNCPRWYCGGIPTYMLFVTLLTALIFRKNFFMTWVSLLVNFLGAVGLMFWSIEYWNVSTRHRTEYYDTHDTYFAMLLIATVYMVHNYITNRRLVKYDELKS